MLNYIKLYLTVLYRVKYHTKLPNLHYKTLDVLCTSAESSTIP